MDYTIKRGDMEIQITAEEFQELMRQAEIQDRENDVVGEYKHKYYNDISPTSIKGLFLLPDLGVIRNDFETAFSAVESVDISGYENMSKDDMARLYTENDNLDSACIDNVTVNMINRNGVPHKVTTNAEGFFMAVNNFKENYRDFYNAYEKYKANYQNSSKQSQEKER